MNPKIFVSIGIVARNEEKYIGETINSLQKLNYPKKNYEIIVVDGNSTDRTFEIAKNLSKKSKIKIKVLKESDFKGKGLCFARNLVVKQSSKKAKYIAFTDADCKVDKNWLKILVEKLENNKDPKIAGIGGPRYPHPKDEGIAKAINLYLSSFFGSGGSPAFVPKNIKYANSIPNYNALYRKDILQKFPYDEKLIISDDSELNFRLRKLGYKFLYTKEAKIYHHEDDSIKAFAKKMFNYGINICKVMKKHKTIPRIYALLPFLLITLLLGLPFSLFIPFLLYFYIGIFLVYFTLIFFNALTICLKEKNFLGLYSFILMPIQHFNYALGILYELVRR